MATRRQITSPGPLSTSPLPQPAPDLASSLYIELHRLAAGKMRFERGNHTLQPTALVNEAYLRLEHCAPSMWEDRARILGTAANVMRHILVDHARSHRAAKRGDGMVYVSLDEGAIPGKGTNTADITGCSPTVTDSAPCDHITSITVATPNSPNGEKIDLPDGRGHVLIGKK